MPNLDHVSPPNPKTDCYSFDVPAKVTCPGMTESCGGKCYAFALARVYKGVKAKQQRNLELANSREFVSTMIRDIPRRCEFRIHVSGDFYSLDYIRNWRKICAARPDVTFYTYTRSWRVDSQYREAIWFLNALDNVNINLSVDIDTGAPDFDGADFFRWAYLSHDNTAPNWLRKGDIVFRSNHNGQPGNHKWQRKKAVRLGKAPDDEWALIHKMGEATVCPMERGTELPKSFSCAKCQLCVAKPRVAALV